MVEGGVGFLSLVLVRFVGRKPMIALKTLSSSTELLSIVDFSGVSDFSFAFTLWAFHTTLPSN